MGGQVRQFSGPYGKTSLNLFRPGCASFPSCPRQKMLPGWVTVAAGGRPAHLLPEREAATPVRAWLAARSGDLQLGSSTRSSSQGPLDAG